MQDLYAWWLEETGTVLGRVAIPGGMACEAGPVQPAPRTSHAEVKRCNEIYSTAYKDNWGFVPLTDAEFEFLAKQLNQIAHEKQVLLAEAAENRRLLHHTPDEAIRPLGGRLTTFGRFIGLVPPVADAGSSARMLVLVVRHTAGGSARV